MRHNIIDDKIYARLIADTELKDAYAEKSFPVPGGSPQKNKEFPRQDTLEIIFSEWSGPANHYDAGLCISENEDDKLALLIECIKMEYNLSYPPKLLKYDLPKCKLHTMENGTLTYSDGKKLNDNKYIYIWLKNGVHLVPVMNKSLQNEIQRHTSLGYGMRVLCAGELKIKSGALTYVDNSSGHYKPKGQNLLNFAHFLSRQGFDGVDYKCIASLDEHANPIFKELNLATQPTQDVLLQAEKIPKAGMQLEEATSSEKRAPQLAMARGKRQALAASSSISSAGGPSIVRSDSFRDLFAYSPARQAGGPSTLRSSSFTDLLADSPDRPESSSSQAGGAEERGPSTVRSGHFTDLLADSAARSATALPISHVAQCMRGSSTSNSFNMGK